MMALPKIAPGDKSPLEVSPQSAAGNRKAKLYLDMGSCAELFRRSLSQIIQPSGLPSSNNGAKEKVESCTGDPYNFELNRLNSKPQSTPGGGGAYEDTASSYGDDSEAQAGSVSAIPRREAAWKRARRNESSLASRVPFRNTSHSVSEFSIRPLFVKQFFYKVSEWELSKISVKVTPDFRERGRKKAVFQSLEEIVRSLSASNDITLDVTGSTACDIDATHSDLDLAVTAPRADPLAVLQEISNLVGHAKFGRSPDWPLSNALISLVHRARVPILSIRLQNPPIMNCDVSVNTINSMRHTELFQKLLKERTILRPVMRLLKHWLRERHIPSMREGGLPTIGWMVLAVTETGITGVNGQPSSPNEKVLDNDLYSLASKSARSVLQDCLSSSSKEDEIQDNKILLSIMNFFHRLKDRENLTKTVSLLQPNHNTSKDLQDVFERVLSPQNHGGVWDELLTIEDPASILEPGYSPYNVEDFGLLSFPSPASRTPSGFSDDSSKRRPMPKFDFAAGDLASKISSATWLVYQFELLRADFLFSVFRLFEALVSSKSKQCVFTANSNHFYQRMEELAELPVALTASVFKSLPESMYVVPVRINGTQDCQGRDGEASLHPNVNGAVHMVGSSQEEKDSVRNSDFVLVLLEGDLHVVKLNKICIDWKSWWSREFLSRRDIRSVMHCQLCDVCVIPSPPPPEGSTRSGENKLYLQVMERKENIILNPCNFVSRVHVQLTEGPDPPYLIDHTEAVRLAIFRVLATRAPYWKSKVARKLQPLALPLQSLKLQCMTCATAPDTGSLAQILDYNGLDELASVETDVFFKPVEDLQSLKFLDQAFGVEIPSLLRMAEDLFRKPPPPPPSYPPKTATPRCAPQPPPLTSTIPTAPHTIPATAPPSSSPRSAKPALMTVTGNSVAPPDPKVEPQSPEHKKLEKWMKKQSKQEKRQKNTSRPNVNQRAQNSHQGPSQDRSGTSTPELVAADRQNSSSSRKESRDTSSSTADNTWTNPPQTRAPMRLTPQAFARLQSLLPKSEEQAQMGKVQRPGETK